MRFLALIGALAIIAALGAAIYFFGGFYNVAQSGNNPAIGPQFGRQLRSCVPEMPDFVFALESCRQKLNCRPERRASTRLR